jgi:hypothetical protein
MSDNISIQIPKSGIPKIIAKTIIAVAFGLLMGRDLGSKKVAQSEKGQRLTREQYASNYENYRTSSMNDAHTIQYHMLMTAFGMLIVVVGYEILGSGLCWVIRKACSRNPKEIAEQNTAQNRQ